MTNRWGTLLLVAACLTGGVVWAVDEIEDRRWEREMRNAIALHNAEMRNGRYYEVPEDGGGLGTFLGETPDWMRYPEGQDWRWDNLTLLLNATSGDNEGARALALHVDAIEHSAQGVRVQPVEGPASASLGKVYFTETNLTRAQADAWTSSEVDGRDWWPGAAGGDQSIFRLFESYTFWGNGSAGAWYHIENPRGIIVVSVRTNWAQDTFLYDPAAGDWLTTPARDWGDVTCKTEGEERICTPSDGPLEEMPAERSYSTEGVVNTLATPTMLRRVPRE